MAFCLKHEASESIPVFENVFLIHAAFASDATLHGIEIGRDEEGDSDGSVAWDDKPAVQKFVGVRKTVLCVDPANRPRHKTEVTYSRFSVSSMANVEFRRKQEA
jgi:hypothetical protein